VVADIASRVILEEDLATIYEDSGSSSLYSTVSKSMVVVVDYLNVQSRTTALSLLSRSLMWIWTVWGPFIPTQETSSFSTATSTSTTTLTDTGVAKAV
jgi:hypothetical protein